MAAINRILFVTLLAVAGCRGRQVASVPRPELPAEQAAILAGPREAAEDTALAADSVVTDTADAVVADSAADEQALTALEDLDLDSLGNGRVTTAPADTLTAEVAREAADMFSEPAAMPTYDIDVTTFADHKAVKLYMGFFQRLARDRFEIWLGRMARYETLVRERFAAEGIPEDMVYLGLIESGFSNTAVSRAKAVGMWQFMAGTARRYGLQVGPWVDERRDPFKATDAAARLLSDLNDEFGSWYLAAAAYNGGAGRVSRGLRRLRAADTASDGTFFRLSDKRYLKRETRDYVPKLIAAALIAKTPARYGFDRLSLLPPLRFDEITVSEQTGMDVLARLADTTAAALAELNPQFFRGVTPPGTPVVVRVPAGSGLTVAQRWAELPAGERVTTIEHVIARGETISEIARKYRVDQSLVIAANPKVRPRALRIGQRLMIPVSISARSTYATARRVVRRPAPPPASGPAVSSAVVTLRSGEPQYHMVEAGDTLWEIGRRYGVKVSDLRRWNGLSASQVLRRGGRLQVTPPELGAP